jgi:uncharacterized protein (TIGR00369 family)
VADLVPEGFNKLIGFVFVRTGPDEVEMRLDIQPHHQQIHGIVHGGLWCTMVETAASIGAGLWLGDKGDAVGVSNHTDFLRAMRTGTATAIATPIHRGRQQQLWLVEITDEGDRLVARGQVRIQNVATAGVLGLS